MGSVSLSKFKFGMPCHSRTSRDPTWPPSIISNIFTWWNRIQQKIVGNIFDRPTKFMISLGVINTPCIAWSFNNPQKGLSSNYPSNMTMCSRNWIVNIEIDYSMAILLDHQCSITLSTLWKLFLWLYFSIWFEYVTFIKKHFW